LPEKFQYNTNLKKKLLIHELMKIYDTIIVGGGVTGWGAAMYAGRLNLKTLIMYELNGGLITWTDNIENYPGFKQLTGMELAKKLEDHAKEYDVEEHNDFAETVTKDKDDGFTITTRNGEKFRSKTIIIATGTKVRLLGAPGEEEFTNKGVHYCALCDGAFYKDKVVALIGGADSAVKEALTLSNIAKKVYIIARGPKLRAEPINMDRLKAKKNIEVITETNVKEIKGDKFVTHLMLDKEHKGSKKLDLNAIFVAIGHIPLNELGKQLNLDLDNHGHIKVDKYSRTKVDGVYAAGDICDTEFKQAITGVAEGVHAAYQVSIYVNACEVCPK